MINGPNRKFWISMTNLNQFIIVVRTRMDGGMKNGLNRIDLNGLRKKDGTINHKMSGSKNGRKNLVKSTKIWIRIVKSGVKIVQGMKNGKKSGGKLNWKKEKL